MLQNFINPTPGFYGPCYRQMAVLFEQQPPGDLRLAGLIQKGTGLKVNTAEKPLESVAIGLSKIIKEDNYKSLAYAIEGMGK